MRTIKFRVWRNDIRIMGEVVSSIAFQESSYPLGTLDYDSAFEWKDTIYSMMQFTGLLDKNGKDIYEGDIVRYDETTSGDYDKSNQIGQIIFDEGGFDIHNLSGEYEQDLCACTMNKCIEVIGNIYENQELLTKGE